MKKRRKKSPALLALLLAAILLIAGGFAYYAIKYMPTREKADLAAYYGSPEEGEAAIILGSEILSERGRLENGQAYLPLAMVQERLNQRFYWDSEGSRILYATPSQVLSSPALPKAGGEVWQREDGLYLSLDYVRSKTDLDASVYEDPGRIALQKEFSDLSMVTVLKKTQVRILGGVKAEILKTVEEGDQLLLLSELEDWCQVATWDGYIGYVSKKRVSAPQTLTMDRVFTQEEVSFLTLDKPVNLVWHQVTVSDANAYLQDMTAQMTGVNVISPTWFFLADNAGNLTSLASSDYVAQAHEKGLQVWGLVENLTGPGMAYDILSSTQARANLIENLVQEAANAGMDGINVDFELLSVETIPHFLEFLRELSIRTHELGLVLSVDDPVPENYTGYYDRAEQGRVADYIIIMGYDEHYDGSAQGSVASLPWVEQGVLDTIAEVPADRTLLALPFYTRLWWIQAGTVHSSAIGMDEAARVVAEGKTEPYWDTQLCQYVAAWEKDGLDYEIWLEEGQSIAAKLAMAKAHGLGGAAAWRLGFENSSIWAVLANGLA